ncbi:hypothetical protein J6590_080543 [Homalodisca vitripennis]|nr:hypothetical protein J6590_080543 [Homalodisca vitripennis]
MPALPCFGMNTTLDTLQDSGMYLRATEALNSLHRWGRRMSNPRCKQTGFTPSPPGAFASLLKHGAFSSTLLHIGIVRLPWYTVGFATLPPHCLQTTTVSRLYLD